MILIADSKSNKTPINIGNLLDFILYLNIMNVQSFNVKMLKL